MKKLLKRKEFFISVIITLLLSTWVNTSTIMNENTPMMIKNNIGFPTQWLTIYSNESNRSVFSLLFEGNKGVSIPILNLMFTVLIFYFLIILIKKLIAKIKGFISNKNSNKYKI